MLCKVNGLRSICAVLTVLVSGIAAGQNTVSIAQTADSAPDGDGFFLNFSSNFSAPLLNNGGQAVFTAKVFNSSAGSATDSGVFRGGISETLIQVAREGQAAPDGVGTLNDQFERTVSLNNTGEITFITGYNGSPSARNTGIVRSDAGALTSIVREGDAAPIPIGTFESNLYQPVINDSGTVAFGAYLAGTFGGSGDDWGVFRGDGGNVTQIARENQAIPGGGTGSLGDFFYGPSINASGIVVFEDDRSSGGIFSSNGNQLNAVARAGDALPGANGSLLGSISAITFYDNTAPPVVNDSGGVLYEAQISGVSGSANYGLFVSDGLSPTKQIVREGDAPPSTNGTFSDTYRSYTFNNLGQALFFNDLNASDGGSLDDTGLFMGDGSDLIEVAREGQNAPGGGSFSEFTDYALNQAGQVAFTAIIDLNDGGTRLDTNGLFFFDGNSLSQVVREGDALFNNSISRVAFDGSVGGLGLTASGLNDFGQIAFGYELSNTNAGIAIWSSELTGDYNADGFVSQADLDLVLLNWGDAVVPAEWLATDQFDGVQVSQNELDGVLLNWGNGTPPALAIPEPGAAVLLGLGVMRFAGRNRRGKGFSRDI